MQPLSYMPSQPTPKVSFFVDTPITTKEDDEEEAKVRQISVPIVTQYEPPLERSIVKFETSNELSDDVRV